jgi:hypothetical protein
MNLSTRQRSRCTTPQLTSGAGHSGSFSSSFRRVVSTWTLISWLIVIVRPLDVYASQHNGTITRANRVCRPLTSPVISKDHMACVPFLLSLREIFDALRNAVFLPSLFCPPTRVSAGTTLSESATAYQNDRHCEGL